MNRLLLVEDDRNLGESLKERLEKECYSVDWAQSKAQAVACCKDQELQGKYDLLILDVGLPDGSGLDLARDLRLAGNTVPIIFLSALSSAEYRLEGFELGAEDYIPKPFHLKELLLRIQKALEAKGTHVKRTFGSFSIDTNRMAIIFQDGQMEYPSARDFQLLCFLVDQAPRVISRDEILKELWSNDHTQSGRTIDNAVMRLRQLLRRVKEEPIRSVRGIGYQWVV